MSEVKIITREDVSNVLVTEVGDIHRSYFKSEKCTKYGFKIEDEYVRFRLLLELMTREDLLFDVSLICEVYGITESKFNEVLNKRFINRTDIIHSQTINGITYYPVELFDSLTILSKEKAKIKRLKIINKCLDKRIRMHSDFVTVKEIDKLIIESAERAPELSGAYNMDYLKSNGIEDANDYFIFDCLLSHMVHERHRTFDINTVGRLLGLVQDDFNSIINEFIIEMRESDISLERNIVFDIENVNLVKIELIDLFMLYMVRESKNRVLLYKAHTAYVMISSQQWSRRW